MFNDGEKVILVWNGYPGVPRWMSHGRATVVATKRTRVVVNYQGHEYSVRPDQIRHIIPAEAERYQRERDDRAARPPRATNAQKDD